MINETPQAEAEQVRAGIRESHARLHRTAAQTDDATMRRPSRLPSWTVGHVLTHLARNADSVVRRLEAVSHAELVEQYPDGRTTEIEQGASRQATAIVDDLRSADNTLDELTITAAMLSRQVRRGDRGDCGGSATLLPVTTLLWSRWREIEVHHVDLDLGYTSEQWPSPLISWMLPRLLESLSDRTVPGELAAWALDRGAPPRLRAWGT